MKEAGGISFGDSVKDFARKCKGKQGRARLAAAVGVLAMLLILLSELFPQNTAAGSTAARAAILPLGSVMRISRCSLAGLALVSISKMRLPRKKLSSIAYTTEPVGAAARPDSADHGMGVPSARLADWMLG